MTRHFTHHRPRLLLAVLTVLLVAAVSTTVLGRAGARTDRCGLVGERAEQRAAVVTGAGADVLVIGDSYSVGAGVRARDSWPVRLPGRVRVDGFSGSGFTVGASQCGDASFATRAARSLRTSTALVVVEGGLNDYDQSLEDLEAGFARLMQVLDGRQVLIVGPPPAPERPRTDVEAVDAALARLAADQGTAYLSMIDVDLTYLDDDLHPDPAGHRVFGDRVADRVRDLLG
ncbi:SGNH/GDSL hydrolase family protein [Nocardioides sp. WS12]|uniref:SGNH/GDSL hydrolase family protein n=1 Tax=Nocardioides sp. WS12 TaxID=2486272 RepID=UPI0015FCAFF7|nr:SGNH/GDSL hydrolase family protein [Nocardioides sp. WS12]